MKLTYEAYNQSGQAVRGTVEAASVQEATDGLFHQGLYVTTITEERGGRAGPGKSRGRRPGGHGSGKELASFTRQLAVLTSTGTPVVQALGAAERQMGLKRWRSVVADIRTRVEEGETLVQAMEHHPRSFGPVYRSLVAAGESGGQLGKMLDRLAMMTRQQLKVRNSIVGAMTYPALLLIVSLVVVVVMLTTVLPRFTGLFKTLDAPIPPTTKALMSLSAELQTHWWAWLLGAGAIAAGAAAWVRTAHGRATVQTVMLRLPVIGSFSRSLITARIARVLGVLLESRVPMLESLRLTQQAAGNLHYRALLERAEHLVTHGESVSQAFRESPLVSASVFEALQTGEKTGQIGPILLSMADAMDEDNEVVIRSLTSLMEPAILIVLGAVVGFVAVSLFMPLFDLTSATQG
jgi:type II secretory pathway component PulF